MSYFVGFSVCFIVVLANLNSVFHVGVAPINVAAIGIGVSVAAFIAFMAALRV